MSEIQLFADVPTRKFVSDTGGSVDDETIVEGDIVKFSFNFVDRSTDLTIPRNDLAIRTMKLSLGKRKAPPDSGSFSVRGLNAGAAVTDSSPMDFASDAATFTASMAAVIKTENLTQVTSPSVGCWVFRTASGAQMDWLTQAPSSNAQANLLLPLSFVRIRFWQGASNEWWHEIRLIQTPYAFAGTFSRELGLPPSIAQVQLGAAGDGVTTLNQNEIQSLAIPRDFAGTYTLTFNYKTTRTLSTQDGPDEIAAALNAIYGDTRIRFKVTLPVDRTPYIEFTGTLAAAPQALITVNPTATAPGVPTITLDCDRAELHVALRLVDEIDKLPLELEVRFVDDPADIADLTVPDRVMTYQLLVTLISEQIWDELGVNPYIDWVKPPTPTDYIPFDADSVITGTQFYTTTLGAVAGDQRIFNITHGLATSNIASVLVRQNIANGFVLDDDDAYTCKIVDANNAIITFPANIAHASMVVTFASAGPASAFQAHHHSIGEIDGLQAYLDALSAAVTAIQATLPSVTPGVITDQAKAATFKIPDRYDVYPGRFSPAIITAPPTAPRVGGLLPAVHDAVVTSLFTTVLPDVVASAGSVFVNAAGAVISVPAGLGRRSSALPVGGFLASDGRVWYIVNRLGVTSSYFPADFERTIIEPFWISPQQLRVGGVFSLEFDVDLKVVLGTSAAQYEVVIEFATAPSQASPATTAQNLQDLVWNATPILTTQVILSNLLQTHHFGTVITVALDGTVSADKIVYDLQSLGAAHPAAIGFAIRVRLICFDTENSVSNAKGVVYYGVKNAEASLTNS